MLKHFTPVLLVSTLAACSTPMERRHANGNEEYLNAGTDGAELTIPAGLKAPRYSREFTIPELGPKADVSLVGVKLDIRPPLQVLPMAEGTHVEEGSDSVKVIVESVDNSIDLKKEIYDYLLAFLAKRNIGVASANFDTGIIDTDWIDYEEVIDSSMFGSDEVYTLKQKYRFDVQVRPHGRTGAIVIELLDHQESYDGDAKETALTGEDKRRYTVDMLNSAIGYMSLQRESALRAKRVEQSLGIPVTLEAAEQSYFVADAGFDKVWDRLRIVLPEMGFEVSDMDRSKKLVFLNYNDDSGFWSSLWGDQQLPLKKGGYRLLLEATDNPDKTRILLRTIGDEPLDNQTIDGIYNAFRDLMSEDRKVR
ncbi:MAG: outer membrane protein assembly factor BamC [Shewanella sp.]|nr:outer membrane protein assembly factor BamC [Shewanella sp.]MCF1431582.1 outer membrane protein assembly factor BamC [Shewanella sp.]MCF1437890.1 outer membrane protein assembly factor BamC [Shewanella sp.]MCF1456908.1 outer membrane protein assembly factor BamC [Shewanella sp.]